MSAKNHQDIINGLAQIKASGAYHDFVIRCVHRSWRVHRLVICLQSDFFRKVCDGNSEEARKGEITLAESDPGIVDRMIDYLYLSDYSDVAASPKDLSPHKRRLVINALVYAIADQYAIPHL
ncbi:hypothetical protein MMC27_004807 [Xylographa pallens]|nr:hypothetical protein [Xylographa pallens]